MHSTRTRAGPQVWYSQSRRSQCRFAWPPERIVDLESLFTAENAIALATLTSLEIVLGIDNIVFIAILTQKLPAEQQAIGRRIGLLAAMGMRVGLLLMIGWVMGLTATLFRVLDHSFAGRDLILLGGGLFLVAKATWEIHDKLEGPEASNATVVGVSLLGVTMQIMILDVVFSLDSVITAVGMAQEISVMITAVVLSIGVMLVFAESISRFIEEHPTLQMLALSFLILIGVMLIAESLGQHVDKRYIYFAMAFSIAVEVANMAVRNRDPLRLKHGHISRDDLPDETSGRETQSRDASDPED
jgi:predicted tellurium resistance membrane protein TerC